MSRQCRRRVLIVSCGIVLGLAGNAAGQTIHLPPTYRPLLPKDEPVLVVKAVPDSGLWESTLSVQDGQLVIATPGKGLDIIPLGGRAIRDVVAELRAKHPGQLTIDTDYPLQSTRFLRSSQRPLPLQHEATITANPDDPTIGLGFGVVFSLSDDDRTDDSGLLSQAGFQLDVTGVHQFLGPPSLDSNGAMPWAPLIYGQTRLGLNADQQLNVTTEEESDGPGAGDQFETALEQADQVAVSAQVDFALPLVANRLDFVLTPAYAVSWTQLDPFDFPPILSGDTAVAAEAVFSPDALEQTLRDLGRTLPLSEYGINGLFQFRQGGQPLFYVGGGIMRKEVVTRRFLFERDSVDLPVRNSLQGEMDTPEDTYWRAMFGARIAGVLDVRVDASGPIGDRKGDPLLRVVLGRSFPIVSR